MNDFTAEQHSAPVHSPVRQLPIDLIRRDSGAQFRPELNQQHVQSLMEAIQRQETLPPIITYYDGETYWMADGEHRIEATLRLNRTSLACEVREGSRRDAVFFGACGSNAGHGLPRTAKTKRAQVRALLADEEWCGYGISEIARLAKVSRPFVYQVLNDTPELHASCKRLQDSHSRMVARGGQTYPMNVSNMTFRQVASEGDGDVQTGWYEANEELWAEYPVSLLTDRGVFLDGERVWNGVPAGLGDGPAMQGQPLMVSIYPDNQQGFFWLSVQWQGSDRMSGIKNPVAAMDIVLQLHGLGVSRDLLASFRWTSQPRVEDTTLNSLMAQARHSMGRLVESAVEMGKNLREAQPMLPPDQFAAWAEAEFDIVRLDEFMQIADLANSGADLRTLSKLTAHAWGIGE